MKNFTFFCAKTFELTQKLKLFLILLFFLGAYASSNAQVELCNALEARTFSPRTLIAAHWNALGEPALSSHTLIVATPIRKLRHEAGYSNVRLDFSITKSAGRRGLNTHERHHPSDL